MNQRKSKGPEVCGAVTGVFRKRSVQKKNDMVNNGRVGKKQYLAAIVNDVGVDFSMDNKTVDITRNEALETVKKKGCEVRDCEVNVDMVQSEIVGMTNKIHEKMESDKGYTDSDRLNVFQEIHSKELKVLDKVHRLPEYKNERSEINYSEELVQELSKTSLADMKYEGFKSLFDPGRCCEVKKVKEAEDRVSAWLRNKPGIHKFEESKSGLLKGG